MHKHILPRQIRQLAPRFSIIIVAVFGFGCSPLLWGSVITPQVCIEYRTDPAATNYLAHFGYLLTLPRMITLPYPSANNFFSPNDAEPTRFVSAFYPGNHADVGVADVPLTEQVTLFLGAGSIRATPLSFGDNTKAPSPTCAPALRPATLSYTSPGIYTHQFLGQVDSGPAADPNTPISVTALVGGQAISLSNLSYLPNDTANPTNSLNPNSIYGDVTVGYAAAAKTSVRVQLAANGQVAVRGIASLLYAGPAIPPSSTISFSVENHTFGDAPFQVGAVSNSSGAISYGLVSGPAQVSGSNVTVTGAGTVTLQAAQAAVPYSFSATTQNATFTVNKAQAGLTLGNLLQPYTGSPAAPSVTTSPSALAVTLTYDGSLTAPTAAGSYNVAASITDENYQGVASGTLVIAKPVLGTVVLTCRTTVTKVATGYSVTIVVTNSGTGTAQNVVMKTATLGAANESSLPVSLGALATTSGSATVNFIVPFTAGNSGSVVLEKLALSYLGGTTSVSARVPLP